MFKINNKDARIVSFDRISHLFLVFLFLTFNGGMFSRKGKNLFQLLFTPFAVDKKCFIEAS